MPAQKKLVLKPLELPRSSVYQGANRFQALKRGESPFILGDSEKFLFHLWAKEQVDIVGTEADFFSQDVKGSKRDALYDEPTDRKWSRPYRIKLWFSWPVSSPVSGEEGFSKDFKSQVWVPVTTLVEAQAPEPKEGDVFHLWDFPFYNLDAAPDQEGIPNVGLYFDVKNVNNDGYINDSPSFVGFRCDLSRRTKFSAERRILPP